MTLTLYISGNALAFMKSVTVHLLGIGEFDIGLQLAQEGGRQFQFDLRGSGASLGMSANDVRCIRTAYTW